ncbi:hypothetical protein Bca101_055488 [Brassica carinata]
MTDRGRGFPIYCRCGNRVSRKTSKTKTNPGRLFHSCPYGDEANPNHLFKWTDESMVEEIEDIKVQFDAFASATQTRLLSSETAIEELTTSSRKSTSCSNTASEAVNALGQDINHLSTSLDSLKIELNSLRNLVVSVLVLSLLYKLLV